MGWRVHLPWAVAGLWLIARVLQHVWVLMFVGRQGAAPFPGTAKYPGSLAILFVGGSRAHPTGAVTCLSLRKPGLLALSYH